jgi:hypothetical protein
MFNSDTELMFPMRVATSLKNARGEIWSQLVDKVSREDADICDQSAFVLLMVKLGGCVACNSDSFRAMRGCTQCARQTIRRFRGSDSELVEQFQQYRADVDHHLKKG